MDDTNRKSQQADAAKICSSFARPSVRRFLAVGLSGTKSRPTSGRKLSNMIGIHSVHAGEAGLTVNGVTMLQRVMLARSRSGVAARPKYMDDAASNFFDEQ
eukprot:TRINITY_DN86932_c0_g1_i1.p3 TRINITY_DN86932_c0_g1~~TRINITY_DN86932_c0_g1_i1.p3  ORF type:complete len:101 (-),score=19.11 TRINITY_DN86932_c0_g1_i1:60-362(-)